MNKFLKLLLILAITPIILATAGFAVLPSSVFAYVKDGKEVFIGSYMVYTFALINAVLSFFGITYLRRVRKKFNDENYPTGVTVVAFVNLLISIMCNYFTFSVLKLMLKNSKMEIPFLAIRLVFTLIAILTLFPLLHHMLFLQATQQLYQKEVLLDWLVECLLNLNP